MSRDFTLAAAVLAISILPIVVAMIRGEIVFNAVVILGIIYFSTFVYRLILSETTDGFAGGDVNVTSPRMSSSQPSTSRPDENQALLSLTNILTASKVVWGITASSFTYAVQLPKVVYIPIRHATAASIFVIRTLLRPVRPILAPVYLAFAIIAAPLLVPVLLAYRFAVLVYPLYVFLGASVICGALAGLLARGLSRIAVKSVLGPRNRVEIGLAGRKPSSTRREKRPRGWSG